jgi:hypothetical protein
MTISNEAVDDAVSELCRQYLIDSYFIVKEVGDGGEGKHLKKVIRYFSTPKQWEEFKEEIEEYGNR